MCDLRQRKKKRENSAGPGQVRTLSGPDPGLPRGTEAEEERKQQQTVQDRVRSGPYSDPVLARLGRQLQRKKGGRRRNRAGPGQVRTLSEPGPAPTLFSAAEIRRKRGKRKKKKKDYKGCRGVSEERRFFGEGFSERFREAD
ncbi:hypothetical protein Ancab_040514 [Ancistrocladus abbreviatus]